MGHTKEIKNEADRMRKDGKSYFVIGEKLGIPKSTLSTWFNKKYASIYRDRQHEHLKKARVSALAATRKKILERQKTITNKISSEIKEYPLNTVAFAKSIIAFLYWAEGTKHEKVSGLIFVNTDPILIKLYVTLLRKCFKIDENKFKIRLHIHWYHDRNECISYWSKVLKIPRSRFGKLYVKKRSVTKKFRRNFRGICFVYYGDSNIRREIIELYSQIARYYCP